MIALRFNDLRQHSDVLRSRSGKLLTVRFVEPRDADALQGYFRSLSVGSRYNRFLGAMSELPQSQLDHFVHVGEATAGKAKASVRRCSKICNAAPPPLVPNGCSAIPCAPTTS